MSLMLFVWCQPRCLSPQTTLHSSKITALLYILCHRDSCQSLCFCSKTSFSLSQVQELHEEEAQWVNYDEDELFVKMQLADSIFDSLLKDTVNVLTLISDKRANRDTLS